MASLLCPGSIVGTIHSPNALAAALRLPKGEVDFFELRVDAFATSRDLPLVEKQLRKLRAPLIVTVRHPQEGGAGHLTPVQRRTLFRKFLPLASLIDVELRSAVALKEILAEAKAQNAGVILSHHDFQKTPALARLRQLHRRAAVVGCDVFKVATTTHTARDLATLLDWLVTARASAPALAVMGMGDFGKISRLVLGKAGSVLNYGYLEKPQVTGQWSAALLKERLRELSA